MPPLDKHETIQYSMPMQRQRPPLIRTVPGRKSTTIPVPLPQTVPTAISIKTHGNTTDAGYSKVMEQKIKRSTIPEWKKRTAIPQNLQGGCIDLDRLMGAGTGVDLSGYAKVEDSVKHTQVTAEMVSSLRGQLKSRRVEDEEHEDDWTR